MKTYITSFHEEEYSDNSRTLGVLVNLSPEKADFKDSFIYIYRNGMYIFFNTIIDMNDYLMYGEGRMTRAYMTEEDFDKYYDVKYFEGYFKDKLSWTDIPRKSKI